MSGAKFVEEESSSGCFLDFLGHTFVPDVFFDDHRYSEKYMFLCSAM